ncbi:unnamed protein product, partial [Discosporangium mesarthrocarpum]
MFNKGKKKGYRRRVVSRDDNDEEEDGKGDAGDESDASTGTVPAQAAPNGGGTGQGEARKKRRKDKAKDDKGAGSKLLSFGNEDEEEDGPKPTGGIFRVKKSKASKAMAKATKEKTELPGPQDGRSKGSWQTATAGMYTKEGMAALMKSQSFSVKPAVRSGRAGAGDVRGGRGLTNKAAVDSNRVFSGEDAELVQKHGEKGTLNDKVLEHGEMLRAKEEEDQETGRVDLGARDRIPMSGGGDEFIPLDGKVPVPGSVGRPGGMALGQMDAKHATGDHQGDLEEQQRWEEEQVRRGAAQQKDTAAAALPRSSQRFGEAFPNGAMAGQGGGGWGEKTTGVQFLGVDEMQKNLKAVAERLRETHQRNERQLQLVLSELEAHGKEEEKLLKDQQDASDRFIFFQRAQASLSDLCGMLREK